MKNQLTKFLCIVVLSFMTSTACKQNRPQEMDVKQLLDINELVVLRTEGLVLTEIVDPKTFDAPLGGLIGDIKAYYQETHPSFLRVCQGQPLVLQYEDFDMIREGIRNQVFTSEAGIEEAIMSLYVANTDRSIEVYERILQESERKDVRRFALRALPGLYNHQKEVHALLRQRRADDYLDTTPHNMPD